ncbi:BREX-6 system phosphatase PglZ [Deltaproteobacteria bacterium TL4]
MGAVKDYLTKQLKEDLKVKGLCVWLDAQEDYTTYVRELQEKYQAQEFEYPVLTFKGSFLELMLELSPWFSSRQNQPCLIHLPLLNQQTILKTPLLEAYKAGKELQYNLKTLIRNACAGKLTPTQLQHLLENSNLSLELADTRLTEEDQTPDGLKKLIAKHSAIEIAIDLLQPSPKYASLIELPVQDHAATVFKYISLQFGIQESWLADWLDAEELPLQNLSALRIPFAAHLLCSEYVWDLQEDPYDERLKILKQITENQHKNCCRVTSEMRERYSDLYRELAKEVELHLQKEEAHAPEVLGEVDTFAFEEEKILVLAFRYLENSDWTALNSLINYRLGTGKAASAGTSFWVKYDEGRRWVWRWLEKASLLRETLHECSQRIQGWQPVKCSPDYLLSEYAQKLFRVDQLHREFEQMNARFKSLTGLPRFRDIQAQILKTRQVYRSYVDQLALLFNQSCKQHGFLPSEEFRQRTFHRQVVVPILAQGNTVVFYIDAFRYELAEALAARLDTEKGMVKLTARLSELPTVTAVGMNALLPIEQNGKLYPVFDLDKGTFSGFKVSQKIIREPAQRKTFLKTIEDSSAWVKLQEICDLSPAELKNTLNERKLIAIHSLEIDEVGENGLLQFSPDFFENTINTLVSLVKGLQKAGYHQFVFTADHGFLQADDTVKGEPIPHMETKTRRYAIREIALENSKATSVSLSALDYQQVEGNWLIFPPNGDLFQKPGDKDRFYHGGNSLQERVIPVLVYSKTKVSQVEDGCKFRVQTQAKPALLGFHRIQLKAHYVGNKTMWDKNQLHLQLIPESTGLEEVYIQEVIPGNYQGNRINIPTEQEIEICFKILGTSGNKVPIKIIDPEGVDLVESCITEAYFQVEMEGSIGERSPVYSKKAASAAVTWHQEIPKDFHPILSHIFQHGAITEQSLVSMLGGGSKGARLARQFAVKIQEWQSLLPFDLEVSSSAQEGKEYRKK